MIAKVDVDKMRSRYEHIHPLIFHRSCEFAKTPGDLFDILEEIPDIYPITWDDRLHRWVTVKDICQES